MQNIIPNPNFCLFLIIINNRQDILIIGSFGLQEILDKKELKNTLKV